MRKASILAIMLILPLFLKAQDTPKAEVFGGFSYLHNSGSNFNGWEGQGTLNLTPFFGLTVDASGHYHTASAFSPIAGVSFSADQRLYNFLAGPTVTARFNKFSVFGHGLFGAAHSSLGAGLTLPIIGGVSTGVTSANAFAMALGGGLDLNLTRHFAIRAVQADYLYTHFDALDALTFGLSTNSSGHQNSFRYSAGIVFRF